MSEDVYRSGAFLLPCFNPRAQFYKWESTDPRFGGESQPIGTNDPAGHGQGDAGPVALGELVDALGEPVDALMEAETQIYTGSLDLGTETPATEESLSSLRPVNDKTASEFRGGLVAPHQNDPHPSRPTNRLTGVASGRVNPGMVGEKQNAGCTRVDGQYRPVDKSPIPVAMRAHDEDIGKIKGVDVLGPTSPLAASLPVLTGPNRKHGRTQQQDPVTGDTLGVRGGMLSGTRDEQAEQKGGAASLDGHRHGDVIDRNASKPKDENNGQAAPGVTPRTASLGHDGRLHSGAMAAAARLPNFETAISFIDVVERLLPIPSTIRLPTEDANDAKEVAIMGLPIRAQAHVDALA
ncbi:unnamed protein product [Closterium sp. NIES-64]|nr:unnamed protein product [Closterium sp. NIES-64]